MVRRRRIRCKFSGSLSDGDEDSLEWNGVYIARDSCGDFVVDLHHIPESHPRI